MSLKTRLRSVTRREVLGTALNLTWIVPLGGSLAALGEFLRYGPEVEVSPQIAIGTAASLPSLPAYIEAGQIWLHRDDQGYYAVDAICTHLGCTIRNNPDDSGYTCPCHGSQFDSNGGVVHGPATRPLHFMKLAWDPLGQLIVDRGAEVDNSVRLPPVA